MAVTNVLEAGFEAPEVAVFDVDNVPATHEEWSAYIGELALGGVFANILPSLSPYEGTSYTMERNPADDTTRDWWTGDHMWHADGTRWEKQPVFTVIGCQDVAADAPKTELLDTVRLLEISLEDGFWETRGLSEDDLSDMRSVFVDSTYYREALPYLRGFATEEEAEKMDAILATDLEQNDCDTVEEFLAKKDEEFPPKSFPLVQLTPISKKSSLFLDGGGRNSRLIHRSGQDFTQVLHEFRGQYLSGVNPQTLGILKSVKWQPDRCLIFPQIGTLHRAQSGNDHFRRLHLGFLVRD